MKKLPQNLSDLEDAFAEANLDAKTHRTVAADVAAFFTKYAELEQELLGDIPIGYPAYLFETTFSEDPLEAGTRLAELERTRLGLSDSSVGPMFTFLDHQGLKLYAPALPENSPIEGLFLFDAKAGPCFLVNGASARVDADFALARLYAHYLLDNNPYRIRLVLAGDPDKSNESLRAKSFAASFLVSESGTRLYLSALGYPDTPLDADKLRSLAAFFEVGPRTLFTRLLSLELISPEAVTELMVEWEDADLPAHLDGRVGSRSERFVRLALEAHAKDRVPIDALAGLLGTRPAAALELVGRFKLDDDEEEDESTASAAPADPNLDVEPGSETPQ